MASHLDERSPKAEKSAPDDAKSRGRTPTFITLLMILFSLAAVSYYLYPKATALFYYLYPKTSISPPFGPHLSPWPRRKDGTLLGNGGSSWPLVKIPGSENLAEAEAYGVYDESEIFEFDPSQPIKRYSLEYGKVACWQDNGVWIKKLTPVELSSLGIDRFQDTDRAPEQADEDAFCTRLRMYGASFWELPPQWPEYVSWSWAIDDFVEPVKKVSLEVGFPTSGGVWVLDTTQGWDRLVPRRVGLRGLRNALTMDERCEVIKELGGRFYEDTQFCTEMAPLLGQQNVLTMDEMCGVVKDSGGRFCENTQVCAEMAPLLGP